MPISLVVKSVLFAVACLGVFLLLGAVMVDLRRRRHIGVAREEFLREVCRDGTSLRIAGAVHDYYTRGLFGRLTITPDDTFEYTLNEGPEDISDDAEYLIRNLGLPKPSKERIESVGAGIKTVREMTLWLESLAEGAKELGDAAQ